MQGEGLDVSEAGDGARVDRVAVKVLSYGGRVRGPLARCGLPGDSSENRCVSKQRPTQAATFLARSVAVCHPPLPRAVTETAPGELRKRDEKPERYGIVTNLCDEVRASTAEGRFTCSSGAQPLPW